MTLSEFQAICAESNMRTGSDTTSYSLEHGQYFLTAHWMSGFAHVLLNNNNGHGISSRCMLSTQEQLTTALLDAVEEMK